MHQLWTSSVTNVAVPHVCNQHHSLSWFLPTVH